MIDDTDWLFPISKIIEGQGLPNIGCTSTSAAVMGFNGFGRGFGRKEASGCFFLPGSHTSIALALAHSSEESSGDATL
jgi:hypothetical protein